MKNTGTKNPHFDKNFLLYLSLIGFIGLINDGAEGYRVRRITGGTTTYPGEFKYLVAIYYRGRQMCGGAIISERHILTAGHCVEDYQRLTVVGGINDLKNSYRSRVHKVSKVIRRLDYQPFGRMRNVERDIAVIVLAERLILGTTMEKVHLPHFQISPGYSATVAGWGYVHPNGYESSHLYKIDVTLLDYQKCSQKAGIFSPDRLCGFNSHATVCGGDSGSPLVYGRWVVGITSASTCIIGQAHMYANVFYYRDWIIQVMSQT